MRFLVMIKANKKSEAGVLPSEKLLTDMGKFNEELVKAGVMVSGEGLHPSSQGARVRFTRTSTTVVDGPFAESKELVAGFWIWNCKSLAEAIEWVKRIPKPDDADDTETGEVEIRRIFELDDFPMTPELKEQEAILRKQLAAQKR